MAGRLETAAMRIDRAAVLHQQVITSIQPYRQYCAAEGSHLRDSYAEVIGRNRRGRSEDHPSVESQTARDEVAHPAAHHMLSPVQLDVGYAPAATEGSDHALLPCPIGRARLHRRAGEGVRGL